MRISVNRKLNVAYVHFQDQPAPLETKRLSGDLFTDVGPDGIVYGPERVNASEHLRRASPSRMPSSASDLVQRQPSFCGLNTRSQNSQIAARHFERTLESTRSRCSQRSREISLKLGCRYLWRLLDFAPSEARK